MEGCHLLLDEGPSCHGTGTGICAKLDIFAPPSFRWDLNRLSSRISSEDMLGTVY